MKPNDIEALAQALQRLGVARCELDDSAQGLRLKLRLGAPAAAAPAPAAATAPDSAGAVAAACLRSPGMGRFATCHPLQPGPAAMPGQRLAAGQTVAYLLIGTRVEAIVAPAAALLGRQLVAEGQLAGYADALFALD